MDGVVDEMVSRPPAPALRWFVGSYTGYRQRGLEPGVHRGLPSPYLTLIFTLDDPLVIRAHPDPAQPAGRFETLIGGLHTSPALITHDGSQSGVQLALSPLGARSLLGLPAGALFRLDVPAEDVLGRFATEIQARLREAGNWPQRFAVLDRMLLDRLAVSQHRPSDRAAGPAPEVTRAWQVLQAGGGAVPIARVASDLGWTPRHLGQQFRAEFGLSPKVAARVLRFDRARCLMQGRIAADHPMKLADVSARCGYFDQAHLAREFRALAGCSPSTWAAEEFRNIQAYGPAEPTG
jgi:AraC-like DNA-binding protein